MASGATQLKTGSYVGNGTELAVKVGFWPRTVEVVNGTDGSSLLLTDHMAKHPTTANRGGLKVNGADGVRSYLAPAAGMTIDDATGSGFSVFTDASCNTADVVYFYRATN